MLDRHLIIESAGKAHENNIIFYNEYRITVLKNRLIRIEKGKDSFLDFPTTSVLFRNLKEVDYKTEIIENGIFINTDEISFFIADIFEDSYAIINGNKVSFDNSENLLSTFSGLDGCDGDVNDHYAKPAKKLVLEYGVCSKNGVAVIDDSKSLYIDENGILKTFEKERFDKYVFAYGHDYQEALKAFYEISGPVPLIPRYALGNWWSRYYEYKDYEYLALIDKFIENDIPLTVATIDTDWHPSENIIDYYQIKKLDRMKEEFGFETSFPEWMWGWTGYSWDKTCFPEPEKFLAKLHKKGLKITLNLHPFTICWYETHYATFAKNMGENPELLKPFKLDLDNDLFLNNYFKDLHLPLEKQGVDFWWIDDTANTYKLAHYYYLDNSKSQQPIILCRYGGVGSHRYPVGFSGDSVISWKSLDYLPYFTLTSSNIGYSWWSHDIGAFMAGIKDDELYIRYVQLGVFLPINRLHCQRNEVLTKEPWAYKNGIGEIAKKQLQYRHKMIPFIYSGSYRNTHEGLALIEPMYYYYPEDKRSYEFKNQYFFNGQLLVAPITTHSVYNKMSAVKVFLPEGNWTDIFTNDVYTGNKVVTMVRTLDSIPILAKEGCIYTLSDDKNGNSIENPTKLEVNVFNGNGNFTLYEDKDENKAFTYFDTYDDNGVQCLSVMFDDKHNIINKRTLKIRFRNIVKGEVYCNTKAKVSVKDCLEVTLTNIDTNMIYEIQVKHNKLSKLEILKKQAVESLTYFEGKNEDRIALYEKINKVSNVSEYIKVINESKLHKVYKQRLKECK